MELVKNYVCCVKCKLYIPLHHPDAIAWAADHNEKCKEWHEVPTDHIVNAIQPLLMPGVPPQTSEIPVLTLAWATKPSSISYRAEPPDGYESAVGLLEQLAYELPPEEPKLT